MVYLSSDNLIQPVLQNPYSLSSRLAKSNQSEDAVVETACLAVVCRPPKDDELRIMRQHFKKAGRRQAIEDLFWALINSKEFLFNH